MLDVFVVGVEDALVGGGENWAAAVAGFKDLSLVALATGALIEPDAAGDGGSLGADRGAGGQCDGDESDDCCGSHFFSLFFDC